MTTTEPIVAVPLSTTTLPTTTPQTRARFGFVVAIIAQILMMVGASAPSPFYPVLAQQIGFAPS